MNAKSMFTYNFSAATRAEGIELTEAIGKDMIPLDGYLNYEVIQDVKDPGHLMINTRWETQKQAATALDHYQHDAKIKRVTELLGAPSPGFTGAVLPNKK